MKIPPALPNAASAPNIVAPPFGYLSAVIASMVGHKQLPVNPASMQAIKAKMAIGQNEPIRKSKTEMPHPHAMIV